MDTGTTATSGSIARGILSITATTTVQPACGAVATEATGGMVVMQVGTPKKEGTATSSFPSNLQRIKLSRWIMKRTPFFKIDAIKYCLVFKVVISTYFLQATSE